MIYTDFSKAFDRVNHDYLLYKLSSYNIHPGILSLLRNYLSDRKHRVVVDGYCSDWNSVPSGVPQGSILGPTLFSLFVNDIPRCLTNNCLLFADDLKVFRRIGCPADASSLQEDKIMSGLQLGIYFLISINVVSCLYHLRRNPFVLIIL